MRFLLPARSRVGARISLYWCGMDRRGWKGTATYVGLLSAAFVVAVLGSWAFGSQLDNSVYDEMFRRFRPKPWATHSALLVIDERSLGAIPNGREGIRVPAREGIAAGCGGQAEGGGRGRNSGGPPRSGVRCRTCRCIARNPEPGALQPVITGRLRRPVAGISPVRCRPRSCSRNRGSDVCRALAFQGTAGQGCGHPRHPAGKAAPGNAPAAVGALSGGVPADPECADRGIARQTWKSGESRSRRAEMRGPCAFASSHPIWPFRELRWRTCWPIRERRRSLRGRSSSSVCTAQTEHDRLFTPYSEGIPTSGIEINADAFETIAEGLFLTDVPDYLAVLLAAALVAAAGTRISLPPGVARLCVRGFDSGGGLDDSVFPPDPSSRDVVYLIDIRRRGSVPLPPRHIITWWCAAA